MQSPGREPSMEDILASIKKVIAEEKELRTAVHPAPEPEADEGAVEDGEDEILELVVPLAPPADLGPPLIDQTVAESSRHSLESLSCVAATVPAAFAHDHVELAVELVAGIAHLAAALHQRLIVAALHAP